MSNDPLRDIYDIEAREQVASLEELMIKLDEALRTKSVKPALLNEIFRAVHSLKAGTGAMGFTNIMAYVHSFETVLDKLRNAEIHLSVELYSTLYDVVGLINADVEKTITASTDAPDRSKQKEIIKLRSLIEQQSGQEVVSSKNKFKISIKPCQTLLKDGIEPLSFLDDLYDSGEVSEFKCFTDSIPSLKDYSTDLLYLQWELTLETEKTLEDIENIFVFIIFQSEIKIEQVNATTTIEVVKEKEEEKKEEAQIEEKEKAETVSTAQTIDLAPAPKAKLSQNIRVDTDKLDHLVNLVGELVIAQARIQNLVNNVEVKEVRRNLTERCNELNRLIEDLKHGVMSTRMVPIDILFSQFHRMVKDLASKQGKNVHLNVIGKETELDKNIIEKISDPLKHLIRNSLDHGIEDAATRSSAKKDPQATVTLHAYQKEGSVFIEIADDGKGLNTAAILKKAIEKGLTTADQKLDDDEIHQFILAPGFSTAAAITEISGRGVGMDVVKNATDDLGGHIFIETEKGKGTTFTIKLPLTLAIIEGLLFRIGQRRFVIPLLAVDETTKPNSDQIKKLEGKAEYLEKRNKMAPLVRLYKIFKIEEAIQEADQAMALHLTVNQKSYALMVDEVIGHQPIVIKGLEQNFEKVVGFGGATILGDGSVVPILDPVGIISIYKSFTI